MMRGAAALFAICFLHTAALAQEAAQPVAPAQTADADAPSESHIAAALDLLQATHASDNIHAILTSMAPLMAAQMKRERPQLGDPQIALIVQKIREGMLSRQSEVMRIYALIYARHFTEDELHGLSAFYRSNLGQKYVTTVPSLIAEAMPLMTRWAAAIAPEIQQEILQSLPKTPDDKS
jgi:uncharacterized protein